MGMGKPITLQTIRTFFLKAVVINFPPSYFSPGAFGDKFPVGSVNLFKLNDSYRVGNKDNIKDYENLNVRQILFFFLVL